MASHGLSHLERTRAEPRQAALHTVILGQINQVNETVRILRLEIPEGGSISFLPGQWLDVHIPVVSTAGGFTITSPPSAAAPTGGGGSGETGHLELAVQASPGNAAAAWLWRPAADILGAALRVRVGGRFVWPPPPPLPLSPPPRRVVFVAGGVGVNPLVSMLAALAGGPPAAEPPEVRFLYGWRDPAGGERAAPEVPFLERIAGLFARGEARGSLSLFRTGGGGAAAGGGAEEGVMPCGGGQVVFKRRRMALGDVAEAVGPDRQSAAVYVCGVPAMTDHFVNELVSPDGIGLEPHRVLYEKWW